MHQTLQQEKFEDADFKYDNIAFKSEPKTPKSDIFGPNLNIFVFFMTIFFHNFYFCTKHCSKTNSRTPTSNMTILFSNSSPKICKQGIFRLIFKDFCVATNVTVSQTNSRALILNMTMTPSNSSPEILK